MDSDFQTQFVTAGSLLYSVEHRPWLPPNAQWLLSQNWNDVLFAHFAMEPRTLRRLVPDALTLDLYDGVAWLTILPFSTSQARPSGVPPLPGFSSFPQVRMRTYVSMEGKAGVYYFSVDAANLSAVCFARFFFRMESWYSSIQISGSAEKAIHFRSSRLHGKSASKHPAKFDVVYAPEEGRPKRAKSGSLDEFLTERYCIYSRHRRKYFRTEIHHQPWPLQRAKVEINANSVADPYGLTLSTTPDYAHFALTHKMLIWAPKSVGLPL